MEAHFVIKVTVIVTTHVYQKIAQIMVVYKPIPSQLGHNAQALSIKTASDVTRGEAQGE